MSAVRLLPKAARDIPLQAVLHKARTPKIRDLHRRKSYLMYTTWNLGNIQGLRATVPLYHPTTQGIRKTAR